ncbi:MAG TPA: wax ester/triacylglycerol synthase family O-acyltransferase [Acidimicrobiales bacterium]|jgi:WS/DGAT/MGAT family acyltransferase
MHQLNRQDTGFLYSETPRLLMHLGSLHTYDPSGAPGGTVGFETILDHVRSRLPLARVLRRRIVRVPLGLDYPYWVEDPDFDLEFHVRHIALPRPGNWRQLWTQATRLHSQPLDLNRPPWELYVIAGVDAVEGIPEGGFAMYIKVHHAAIDGISGIELMNALHDVTPEGRPAPADDWRPDHVPSSLELAGRTALHLATTPTRLADFTVRTANALRTTEGRRRPSVRLPARLPVTRLNQKATLRRTAGGFVFDLDLARAVKRAVPGATVNDVILTVVGGGLRSYLLGKGELPADPLRAGVPVSLRTQEEMGTAGNRIGIMVVTVGTDVEDPVERLRVVQQATTASKEVSTAVPARAMAEAAELLPGAMLGRAIRALPRVGAAGMASMIGNVCVTNVPGSQVPLYLCGARMDAYYGMGPVYDYAGPIHLITSYMRRIFVGVTTAKEIVPDIEHYVDCMERSLAELVAATGADPADVAPAKKAAKAARKTSKAAKKAAKATGTRATKAASRAGRKQVER